jgi:glutamyl-tRNA reductase
MHDIAPAVVSIADACLGGLQGRSALLIGPADQRSPYLHLLRQARMKYVYQEENAEKVSALIPHVQLLINIPVVPTFSGGVSSSCALTAASIAKGCENRRTPLLIFDLAPTTSVEELAGLLPAVCLYTPDDLRSILAKEEVRAS